MPIDPAFARILDTVDAFGLSRSTLYRLANEHRGLFRKAGRRTLVDLACLRDIMAALPHARIGAGEG